MTKLTIWRADDPCDRERWLEAWRQWPAREASAHPTYVELFAQPGQLCRCAWWESDLGKVFFPFIERPLASEGWTAQTDLVDLTNPYGYGGPFCCDSPDSSLLAQEFWPELTQWAHARGAVSLFARLTLFEDHRLPWPNSLVELNPNVVRSLASPLDDIWMNYDHKVRKNVNTAREHGLVVRVDTEGTTLDAFLDVYLDTMDRVGATDWYYFPRSFYERLTAEMPHNFAFFHVFDGDEVVASELVIVSDQTVYSFLGGTRAHAFSSRPNDLLKHEIVAWGVRRGKRAFVLGGGFKANDGIFRYKKSFAPQGVVPYFVGNLILDDTSYTDLVEQRRTWEQSKGHRWTPSSDYFPAYRSP